MNMWVHGWIEGLCKVLLNAVMMLKSLHQTFFCQFFFFGFELFFEGNFAHVRFMWGCKESVCEGCISTVKQHACERVWKLVCNCNLVVCFPSQGTCTWTPGKASPPWWDHQEATHTSPPWPTQPRPWQVVFSSRYSFFFYCFQFAAISQK